MSSGAGFAASGLLQGFAQSYRAARIRATEMEVAQRHGLASTLLQLYPNARPEAQADIAQRLLTIYSTPPGKKLDKGLGDVSTLGRSATQANLGAGQAGMQQAGAAGAAATQAATPPTTASLTPPAEPGGAPGTSGITSPGMNPTGFVPPIPPPPDLSKPGAGYSPLLSPEEHNRMAAATITATETAKLTAEMDARRAAADKAGLKPGTPAYENFVAGRIVSPYAHMQTKYIVGPNGERMQASYNPLTGETLDSEGNVIENPIGWSPAVNAPGTSAYKTFYAAAKSSGMSETEIANDWNTRQSSQHGYRIVPQPDGSIQMVPVTTTSTTSRGQIPVPPSGGGGGAVGAVGARSAAPSVGQGRTVGGKVPPEVAKAQSAYQDSISRFNVMSEALPQALAGNQQAMINLLYNHIGMTVGLQKGARITQDIINEAQRSAPWMATLLARIGVGNGFTMTPELMRGVVLAPEQMHQMVDLAEGRVEQDYRKFQETRNFYKGGEPQTPEQVIAGGKEKQASKGASTIPKPPSAAAGVGAAGPQKGTRRTYQGHDYVFDGKQWVRQ